MAEPLARAGSIRLLEDAVQLLRSAPPATWICTFAGSVPFALALLVAWNTLTNTRITDPEWARDAAVPAMLLVWMNCWRSIFAGRLRRQLSGAPDPPWTLARGLRFAAVQAFFGATRLPVVPVAALVMFPWAATVAFYRNLAVVAGSEDLDPRQMMARARRLAAFEPRRSWTILPLLLFLYLMVMVNLAIMLGLLPQLVRILSGYESAFSRSGVYFVQNPIFVLLVLAVSWIAFDPFVQAVYCIRYFQAESMQSGEDLRSGLRRIRAAAPALAAVALLVMAAPRMRADVAPADLEQAIRQAMQAPEYDWRLPPATVAANTPWIVKVTDRLAAAIQKVMRAIGDALSRFLRWLSQKLSLSGPSTAGGALPGLGLNWLVGFLILAVAAGGAVMAWRMRRPKPALEKTEARVVVRLDSPDLSPDRLPEAQWIELAERYLAEQNFRFALRAFYLASLAWLGRQEFLAIHPGKTNREYETELRRRTRPWPEASRLFAVNVLAFERAWYGLHEVSAEDAAQFRERIRDLKTVLAPAEGVAA
jgi:Domain of unknown function (DUF4129)